MSAVLSILIFAGVLGLVLWFGTRKRHPANGSEIPKNKNPLPPAQWPPPIVVEHDPDPPEPPVVYPPPPVVVNPRWPNAPGWPRLLDPGTTEAEWSDVLWNDKGLVTFEQGGILFRYPKGYAAGAAPGTPYREFGKNVKQLYVGAILKWSDHWEGHQGSGVSKIMYPFSDTGGSIPVVMYGPPNGPFYLRMYPQLRVPGDPALVKAVPYLADNYGENAWLKHGWLISNVKPQPVPIGRPFTLEVVIEAGPGESVTKWFLDGKLQGLYLGVSYPASGFDSFKAAPVWGGMGGVKTHDDYLFVAGLRIEGR